jgi:hypothetical protein
LFLSLVLHVVPLPAYILRGLAGHWLGTGKAEWSDVDHPTVIPIDLEEIQEPKPQERGTDTEPELVEPPAVPPPPVRSGKPDAGTETGAPEASRETGEDAAADRPEVEPEAGADAGAAPDAAKADADLLAAAADATSPFDAEPASLADVAIASRVPGPPRFGLAKLDPSRVRLADVDASALSPDAGAAADAQVESAAPAPATPAADPVRLAGAAARLAPANPNVKVVFYPDRIRRHPLAAHFGPAVGRMPQWKAFFEGTGLDPVRDCDRVLLAGPQFRDSSRVVAVIRHNVPEAKMKAAIRAVSERSGARGGPIQARVPAFKGFADRADRVFVMPGPHLLVVSPPDGLEQALKMPASTGFPPLGDRAVVTYIRTPANAFRGLPIDIPTSIEWMTFSATLTQDGGADLSLDAKDKDAASAAANAAKVTAEVERATVLDLGLLRRRLLDPVVFRAEGDRIRADTHLTEPQLRSVLSAVATRIDAAAAEAAAASAKQGGGSK